MLWFYISREIQFYVHKNNQCLYGEHLGLGKGFHSITLMGMGLVSQCGTRANVTLLESATIGFSLESTSIIQAPKKPSEEINWKGHSVSFCARPPLASISDN